MELLTAALLFATFGLAYANGANDNFKGVATLLGSGSASYRTALVWATVTTAAGAITAFFLATKLLQTFSGKGLIGPDAITPEFMIAVMIGAGLTVFSTALIGVPISTTHALTGGLVGAGMAAVGVAEVRYAVLGTAFVAPLVMSPLMSAILAGALYRLFYYLRKLSGAHEGSTIQLEETARPALQQNGALVTGNVSLRIAVHQDGISGENASVVAVQASTLLKVLHFLSAGAVSFARGLNDTPKIVALLLAAGTLAPEWSFSLVLVMMAIGGIVHSRKIARTMSLRITTMNQGQGFTANLVAAFLVIVASRYGMPVSTTHVTCGSLFGIGASGGTLNWRVFSGIFSAWIVTLPVAAAVSAVVYFLLTM